MNTHPITNKTESWPWVFRMPFSVAGMTSVSPYLGSAQLFFTHDLILTKYYITLAIKDWHFLACLLLAVLLMKVFVAKWERKLHLFWGHLPLLFNHLLLFLVGPSCLLSESSALSIFPRTHLHFGLCMQNDPMGFLALAAAKSMLNSWAAHTCGVTAACHNTFSSS